jgi:hypothetical protein
MQATAPRHVANIPIRKDIITPSCANNEADAALAIYGQGSCTSGKNVAPASERRKGLGWNW